ncbi:MAG: hypothetical protein AYK22_02890 [Thermoplasmatales archaeon SG8-52-3]|nr:MAG: hypothetical protein AYK22_02890 [Thermoplasmatales archaeon SG8-52-3]
MASKITEFFREYVVIFSILLAIIGFFVLFIGIIGFFEDHPLNFLNISDDILSWNLYFLIIGFIILGTGIWYLYSYYKNRKFILEEIKTNKRSEIIKMHAELKSVVKHLPSKYKKMLNEKEEELNIK